MNQISHPKWISKCRLASPVGMLILGLLTLTACSDSLEIKRPTNVILIILDTLRADHVGVYSADPSLTPNLDKLAARSIVFDNAVATSSWTRPSVASILTSKYPTSLNLTSRRDALTDDHYTLAEILKEQAGLTTLGVSTSGNTSAEFGFDQGYDDYITSEIVDSYPNDRPIPIAEGLNTNGFALIDKHQAENGFFLFLRYLDPHAPYLPHPDLETSPEPPGRFDGSRRRLDAMDTRENLRDVDFERIRHLYTGEVRYLDIWMGKLFDELEARGIWEETMIIATSDHGEGLWTHGLRDHGNDLYQETVHVPLLIHYPGMTEADGRRIPTPVSLIDIAPTVLGAFGLEPPDGFQGKDLAQFFNEGRNSGDQQSQDEFILSEMDMHGRRLRSIRRGYLKLIETGEAPCEHDTVIELYDLASDPHERTNLAGQRGDVEARLATALAKSNLRLTEGRTAGEQIEFSDLDPKTLNSLRALGYLSAGEHEAAMAARGDRDGDGDPGLSQGSKTSPTTGDPAHSVIDFSHDPSAANQILYGFQHKGLESRRVCRNSAVRLRRKASHANWLVIGETRPELAPGETISLSVVIDGREVGGLSTRTDGVFEIEGPLLDDLDPGATTSVELSISCERSGAPPAGLDDPSPFCASIRRIELR